MEGGDTTWGADILQTRKVDGRCKASRVTMRNFFARTLNITAINGVKFRRIP